MKHTKRAGRVFQVLAALLLAVCVLCVDLSPALAVTQADIDKLKNNASDLSQQKKELQSKISALSDDIANNMKKKELLDSEISVLSSEISNVESQISTYAELITQTEAELLDAQEREAAQYELFCKRVRAMEERGTISYWSVLFKADSFTDLLSRLDFINEIMDSDQKVIQDLQDLQAEIEEKKESLETQKAESEAAKAELVSKKSELNKQREAANALVAQLRASKSEYQEDMDDLSAEAEAVQAQILKLSKELAAQQAAQGKPSNAALGGYIWPVSSRRITSTFGGRASPGGIGSTNHKGIDIAAPRGTPVYAADGGTVTYAGWMSGYGYLVRINHGNGYETYYGHNSSLTVSVGQHVYKGQQIARVGSTGNSTGNHCHFEVRYNGVAKNPLNYLP